MISITSIISNPEAWITSHKNRRAIKKQKNVYMKNGDNFEIEIFNPKSTPVLARIKINNNEISKGGLKIQPGQRIFLDCFLDSKKKFTFNTYEVEDTIATKIAIAFNGQIEISFYDEYIQTSYYPSTISWNTTYGHSGETIGNLTQSTYSMGGYGNTVCLDSMGGFNESPKNLLETGRIEGGDNSDQKFVYVDGDFNISPSHTVNYHILPESQKPVEVKELVKYCTECGKKSKKNNNFCGFCGTKF